MSQQSSDAFRKPTGDSAPTPTPGHSPLPLEREPMPLHPDRPQPLERESHDTEAGTIPANNFDFGDQALSDGAATPNPFSLDPNATNTASVTEPNQAATNTPNPSSDIESNAECEAVAGGTEDRDLPHTTRPEDELGNPFERREYPRGPMNSDDTFRASSGSEDDSEKDAYPLTDPADAVDTSYRGEPTQLSDDSFTFGDEPAPMCSDPEFNPTPPGIAADSYMTHTSDAEAEAVQHGFSEYVSAPASAADPFDEHAHGFDNPTESISGAESEPDAEHEDATAGSMEITTSAAEPESRSGPDVVAPAESHAEAPMPTPAPEPASVPQPESPKVFDTGSQPGSTEQDRDFQPAGSPFTNKRPIKAHAPQPAGAMPLNNQPPQPPRPDNLPKATTKNGRRSHLPRTYGVWWAATLVFFVLAAALGGYHALEYAEVDPFKLHYSDLRDQKIFMILGGAMLGALFAVWLIQNTAKGLTLRKPDPEGSYNNVYGVLVCLLIVGGLKFSNDIITKRAAAADGGQLAWLRANAYGVTDPRHEPAPPEFATTPPKTTTETTGTSGETQTVSQVPDTKEAAVSPFSKAATDTQTNRPRPGTGQLQLGGATGAVMSKAIRAYQTAAGQTRRADNAVNAMPTPDLRFVNNSAAIEKVALAHADAFIAHRDLARMAVSLPNTTRESLLQAGASMDDTEEQVWVLSDLLKLDRAAEVHRAQAAVHAAQAAYAGYLVEHFGGWDASDGVVRFEDAELGTIARDMQASIEIREQELAEARVKFVGS